MSRTKQARPSYEAFNYNLRPSKHIERRLMMEVFQRLSAFHPLGTYSYVGMGSVYFVDFTLVHRLLGINRMISIEYQPNPLRQRRFYFNKPFKGVEMIFAKSSDALPKIDWSAPAIAWLDYDGMIEEYVFSDVATIASAATSGTVLIVTLNAEKEVPSARHAERGVTELSRLSERVPRGKLPVGLKPADLAGWGVAAVVRQMMANQVDDTLSIRNGVLLPDQRMCSRQIFNFHYRDGARMVTVGFLLYTETDKDKIAASGIPDLEAYNDTPAGTVIDVPHLTNRELRYLERQLPSADHTSIRMAGLTEEEFDRYSPFYRHYPTYAESWL